MTGIATMSSAIASATSTDWNTMYRDGTPAAVDRAAMVVIG
jgi:hypothetical protein